MNDATRIQEWARYITGISYNKFGALQACLRLDPKLFPEVLKALKLKTAEDVVRME